MRNKLSVFIGMIMFFAVMFLSIKSAGINKSSKQVIKSEVGNTVFANISIPIGKKCTKKHQCRLRITSQWCTGSDCLPIQE